MTFNAFISVDLNSVTSTQRSNFYDNLAKKGWSKLKLTTCWKLSSNGYDSETAFRDKIRMHIRESSQMAGIPWSNVEYGFQTGINQLEIK
jgi:hypothetical protein